MRNARNPSPAKGGTRPKQPRPVLDARPITEGPGTRHRGYVGPSDIMSHSDYKPSKGPR